MEELQKHDVDPDFINSYLDNRIVLETLLLTLSKCGYENPEQLMEEIIFGNGEGLQMIRAIDHTYKDIGGFHEFRRLFQEHTKAVARKDQKVTQQCLHDIQQWVSSLLTEQEQSELAEKMRETYPFEIEALDEKMTFQKVA